MRPWAAVSVTCKLSPRAGLTESGLRHHRIIFIRSAILQGEFALFLSVAPIWWQILKTEMVPAAEAGWGKTTWTWVVNFTPWSLYLQLPAERAPGNHWVRQPVWALWRRENSRPYQGWNSDRWVVQPVVSSDTMYFANMYSRNVKAHRRGLVPGYFIPCNIFKYGF
jgi:hypothetical protein